MVEHREMKDATEQKDQEVEGLSPRTEQFIEALGLLILLVCMSCPWVLWWLWGGWAGLGGILLSHVLYMVFLAPKSGICLGIPWILVFFNGIVALVALGASVVWTLFA
jgi:hypothetical protein